MDERWTLKLELIGPHGERLAMALPLDAHVAQQIVRITPLPRDHRQDAAQSLP